MAVGSELPEDLQRLLRLLTIGDESTIDQVLLGIEVGRLDRKTADLVIIAALVATEADRPSYASAIEQARLGGADDEEILQTLIAIAPLVGAARIATALPEVRAALVE
jgi:alkylhydroperoxidase/carboxymuconolactone decarboxylase family protein YurZ